VHESRQKLFAYDNNDSVAIRMEHTKGDNPIELTLRSIYTGNDTLITVNNFHTKVIPTLKVDKPKGYLIPKDDTLLVEFLDNHNITYEDADDKNFNYVLQYKVGEVNESVDEELENYYPLVNLEPVNFVNNEYYFVSTSQLHSNMIVIAFEPQSMYGLVQYSRFNYLLNAESSFPIYRVN
jgi:hypothetical protein